MGGLLLLLTLLGLPIKLTILNIVNLAKRRNIFETWSSIFTLIIGFGFSILWFEWFMSWHHHLWMIRLSEVFLILILLFCLPIISFLVLRFGKKLFFTLIIGFGFSILWFEWFMSWHRHLWMMRLPEQFFLILILLFCLSIISFLVLRFGKELSSVLVTFCTVSLSLGLASTIFYLIQVRPDIPIILYIVNVWLIYIPAIRKIRADSIKTIKNLSYLEEQNEMEIKKNIKFKLLGYLLVSMIGFSHLVFIRDAGISIPIFMVIQFVCLWFLMPRKKPLLLFIPIFILSLNSFISANTIWRIPNFFVIVALFSVMSLWAVGNFSISWKLTGFLAKTIENIFKPFQHFRIPVKWFAEISKERPKISKEHGITIKRVLAGIGISIPLLILILIMLSSADEIFARGVTGFFENIFAFVRVDADFNADTVFRLIVGAVAGFYLFGIIYFIYTYHPKYGVAIYQHKKPVNGDLIIINIVLGSILVVYTLFVLIQFRYLFASSGNLPYGLNYVDYARRGFFELLFLSVVNITIILVVIWLIKDQIGTGMKVSKALCGYLCAVTMVLLVSSFYRMSLYSTEYGLTRLRFLVFGFLIFEAIGLIFTLFYIVKPKFNILAVYAAIALTYYLLLNVVPMDAVIAREQVDRYFERGGDGINYILTLSADAAGEISRLHDSNDEDTQRRIENYYLRIDSGEIGWRQWNLSISRIQRDN